MTTLTVPKNTLKIVIPKATWPMERRVPLVPAATKVLVEQGHDVFVQAGAGSGIDVPDNKYAEVGATVITEANELYAQAKDGGMVITLKAPSPEEFSFMNESTLFCMLHIEQNMDRLYYLGSQKLLGVAMEEIRDKRDERLIDQTSLTGEMGVLYAIRHFQKAPQDMKVVILGYGHVAKGAIDVCSRLGMDYKILRKRELKNLPQWLSDADLLINAISWPEKQREKKEYLVTQEMIQNSKPGMIVLDLAVDFPNPIETIRPTDYQNPFYMAESRVHISIYGYPGLVPVTSSERYSDQILPVAMTIANNGGLADIKKTGELGTFIHHAIVDPAKHEWEKFKPLVSSGSKLE